jgi:hypothetical protein
VSSLAPGATPDELFDHRAHAAVAVVDESLDRAQTSEETWRLALQHFNPRQLVELLLTAGCFRLTSRAGRVPLGWVSGSARLGLGGADIGRPINLLN